MIGYGINPKLDVSAASAKLASGTGGSRGGSFSTARGGRTFGSANNRGARAGVAHAGVQAHASDVKGSGGGHGGNPNHDEHGRFT